MRRFLLKPLFERHANSGGVTINSYHADNGCFADSGFQQSCKDSNQKIKYYTVGAHHQNGIAERHIKELTLISQTLLLHAKRHGQTTLLQWCDHLLSKRLHIVSIVSHFDWTILAVKPPSLTLIKNLSILQHFILVAHHASFWILVFNLTVILTWNIYWSLSSSCRISCFCS